MARNHGIGPRPQWEYKDPATGHVIRYNRHPLRRNNRKVAEMYDCYKDGMSLAKVAKLYGVTRQNVWDLFRGRGYRLRSKKLRGVRTIGGARYTPDGQGYLRGTIGGRRVYAHKVAWEEAHGPIPKTHAVMFRDGDKGNVAIGNLELIPKSEMQRRFNPTGRNQYSI